MIMSRPRSILEIFRSAVEARGLSSSGVIAETDSLDFLKSLVVGRGFLSALPAGAVQAELEAKRIRTLPIEGLPVMPSGFVHRQEVLPAGVSLLLDEMSALVRKKLQT